MPNIGQRTHGEVEALAQENAKLATLLAERDAFIVSRDLWPDFAATLGTLREPCS